MRRLTIAPRQIRLDECGGHFEVLCKGRHGWVFCCTIDACEQDMRNNDFIMTEGQCKECELIRHECGAPVQDPCYFYSTIPPRPGDKEDWEQWDMEKWSSYLNSSLNGRTIYRKPKNLCPVCHLRGMHRPDCREREKK
jgi:hypothetical protein